MNQAILDISRQIDDRRSTLNALSQEIDKTAAAGFLKTLLSPGSAIRRGAEEAFTAVRNKAMSAAYAAHPKVDVLPRASELIGQHRREVHGAAKNMSELASRQARLTTKNNKILQQAEKSQSSYRKKYDVLNAKRKQLEASPIRQKIDQAASKFGFGIKDRMVKTRAQHRRVLNRQGDKSIAIDKQMISNQARLDRASSNYQKLTTTGRQEVIGNLKKLRNEASAPRQHRQAMVNSATKQQKDTYEFARRMEKPLNYMARAGLAGVGSLAAVGGISMARNAGNNSSQQQSYYQPRYYQQQPAYQQQPQQYYQ